MLEMTIPNLNIINKRSKQKELDEVRYKIFDLTHEITAIEEKIELSNDAFEKYKNDYFYSNTFSRKESEYLFKQTNELLTFTEYYTKVSSSTKKSFFEKLGDFVEEIIEEFRGIPYDDDDYRLDKIEIIKLDDYQVLYERCEELKLLVKQLKREEHYILKLIHSGIENINLRDNFRKIIHFATKRLDSEHSLVFNY